MTPLSLIFTAFSANSKVTWHVTDIKNPAWKKFHRFLVPESLVRFHPWSIFWDEIDRKFGRTLRFWRPVTLKLISLGRSHRALSKSHINLWLHWVWLWRLFSPTLVTWPIWKTRPEINFILVQSFWIPVSCHSWSISCDEMDRKFGRISESRDLQSRSNWYGTYNLFPLPSTQVSFKSETKCGRADLRTVPY